MTADDVKAMWDRLTAGEAYLVRIAADGDRLAALEAFVAKAARAGAPDQEDS